MGTLSATMHMKPKKINLFTKPKVIANACMHNNNMLNLNFVYITKVLKLGYLASYIHQLYTKIMASCTYHNDQKSHSYS